MAGRFGRRRMPVISLEIHTEHSTYKITNDTGDTQDTLSNDTFAKDIVSFKTTNDMSDDSGTFSIVLGGDTQSHVIWDRVIGLNDIIVIRIDNNESKLNSGLNPVKNNVIMTGLVSEVSIVGDYGSDSNMFQITGRTFSQLFSQFKIGMISSVESSLSSMGWLWDSGMDDTFYTDSSGTDSSSSNSDDSDDAASGSGAKVGDFDSGSGSTRKQVLALAKQIGEKLGMKNWKFVAAQCMGESGQNFNSNVAKKDTNYSGIVYARQKGAVAGTQAPKKDGGMAYARFKNKAYWALAMYNTLYGMNKSSGGAIAKADTALAYAKALHSQGYFTANPETYASNISSLLKKVDGASSNSSSSSTSGSSSTTGSTTGNATSSSIAKEKSASAQGGVAFYGNDVKGIENALIKRFQSYMTLNYDNSGATVWSFLDYSGMTSWPDEELMDSSSFVNFTGSLYELQKAALREPFNEMYYDSTSDGKAKLVIRRTPFDEADWSQLEMYTAYDVITEQISKTNLQQYSVFVDNPASGMFSLNTESVNFGSYPRTRLDLIGTYGYSKLEVSDLYIHGMDDDSLGRSNGTTTKSSSQGTSKNNSLGSYYSFSDVEKFLNSQSKTALTQNKKSAQSLANDSSNISMAQATSIVQNYIANGYRITEDGYNAIMNIDNGGGQPDTGINKISYKKVSEFIGKSKGNISQFFTLSKAYFENVSDEELTALFNASEDGKISEKAYKDALKNYKKDSTGETGTSSLVDADIYQTKLFNWYANDQNMWSGTYSVLGNPDIRIGMIFNYQDPKKYRLSKYPGRRFYIESVEHDFSYTDGYTSSVGVTRGMIAPSAGITSRDDPRFSASNMWGTSVPYYGGYMGEAAMNYLSYASTTNEDSSDNSSDVTFSGNEGPATAVKAAKFGAKFQKSTTTRKEMYNLGSGHSGSNPLESKSGTIALDCSGFVYNCFRHVGLTIGSGFTDTKGILRDSKFKHMTVPQTSLSGLEVGDLVYLYNYGHIMFYIGGGKLLGWQQGTNPALYNNTTGGCMIVTLSQMGGKIDSTALRLKG